MLRFLHLASCLLLFWGCTPKVGESPIRVPQPVTQAELVDSIAQNFWEDQMQRYPTWATYVGDQRFDDQLTDLSGDARRAWAEHRYQHLAELKAIDVSALDRQRRLTVLVMRETLEASLEAERWCASHSWDVDQLGGYQVDLPQVGFVQKLRTVQEVGRYIVRLSKIELLLTSTSIICARG